ncbi:S1C family serine protease [Aliarcobacter cryaerophilus]|uniref:S1C family serine protease n=1 Tax=Aliarcobacter cryaerophilus TaxID=28198 RepID=UPI0021B42CB7|nr:S1C family serine protease [Aliarcobacter cryaerophilus]MCT7507759.1 serine protease [Aliarcobacter cryaerophilus]
MKKLLLILTLSILSFASTVPNNSVVKIFTTATSPNYLEPWENQSFSNATGSGVIIKDNQILTSAHVVSGGKFIEVQKENDSKKYEATIKYISNQSDLALIEIEDKSFFSNTKALEITEDVKIKDSVTAIGYPIGGNTISTTTGIVSRIEYKNYAWNSWSNLLAIQIDAAINSGNSGGAILNKDNKIVGIAMMKLRSADNISYIVPSIVINTFLNDIKDGKVDGFPQTRTRVQNIENQVMKDYLDLKDDFGVLVSRVDVADTELLENDVLVSINGKKISNDGKIDSKYGKVSFNYEIDTKQIGETVKFEIIRNKNKINVEYKVKYSKPLIPYEFDIEPKYLVFGGLTFTPLSQNYLIKLGAKIEFINGLLYRYEKTNEISERVVWLQKIFPHKVNRGYISGAYIVSKVNGITIKDFNHFVNIIDTTKDEYVVIDFVESGKVVLKTKEAKDSFEQIKTNYGLKSDRRVD